MFSICENLKIQRNFDAESIKVASCRVLASVLVNDCDSFHFYVRRPELEIILYFRLDLLLDIASNLVVARAARGERQRTSEWDREFFH